MSRTILFIGIVLLIAATSAFGEIRLGDPIEYVDQIMGTPLSRGRLGKVEVLNYKDGTQITTKDGAVTDISVRGQIRIGNETTIPEHAKSSTALTSPVRYEPKPTLQLTHITPPPTQSMAQVKSPAETPLAATNVAPAITGTSNVKPATSPTTAKLDASLTGKVKKFVERFLLVFVAVGLLLHGLFSYCFKRICDKNNEDAGVFVWIPIAQFVPLLRVAKMPVWMLPLVLLPGVNYAFLAVLLAKIGTRQNKSPWLAATLILPVGSLFLIPYLAFAGEKSSATEKEAEEDEDDSDETAGTNGAEDENSAEDEFMSFDEDEGNDESKGEAEETKTKDKKRDKEEDEVLTEEFETPFAEMPDPTEEHSKEERSSTTA